MINVFRPSIGEEEIAGVNDVLRSGWIGLGPKTAEFEKRFASFLGVSHCVGVNSCTAALDLALRLLNVSQGDEVIVPTMTFVSTAHAAVYNLAKPIFADVCPKTLSIDIEDVVRKVTPRTRAIVPVHYGGRPIDFDALKKAVPNVPIIEDAAHAAGASYKGKRVGSLGDLGCFSFHAVKNLAMGDGGAISFTNDELVGRAKRLRWLGIDKGTWDRTESDKSYWWEYSVDEVGLKCHLNDIAAAIGLAQLKKLDRLNDRRRQIAVHYTSAFSQCSFLEVPPGDTQDVKSAWHIYCLKAPNRNKLGAYLMDQGIATGVHYTPIHRYTCYGPQPALPNSEAVFERIISLPMYPDMTDEDVEKVISGVLSFYRNH